MVSIGLDGRIQAKGSEVHLVALVQHAAKESSALVAADSTKLYKGSTSSSSSVNLKEAGSSTGHSSKPDGKLVVAEEIAQGHVTWKSMKLLLSAFGGNYNPILFFVIWLSAISVESLVLTLNLWFLGKWGSQYELYPPSEVRVA